MLIRKIQPYILKDLDNKIVLLSGPRQVGKTTLAQSLIADQVYLNFDIVSDRKMIMQRSWPKSSELLIFDELHKMPKWKGFLKGLYDEQNKSTSKKQKIIVTGSARLDIAKKMGDSLAGRHFSYTLNPLTLKELFPDPFATLKSLQDLSGFPEPFFSKDQVFYKRWQMAHLDLILRQDLIDLEQVKNISKMELLVELLRDRVGSPCSYSSLAEDLQVSPATVKNWVMILESLYVVFRLTPYHKNVARSLLKTPKFYFYDIGLVNKEGSRFENVVALAIKSELDFLRNTAGRRLEIYYLRNRDGQEIDFLVTEDKIPRIAVEAKISETSPDNSFKAFFGPRKIKCEEYIQVVEDTIQKKEYPFGVKIEPAAEWLRTLEI